MSLLTIANPVRARTMRAPHLGAFKFLSVGRTHEGRVRKLNEDAFLERPDIGLWAVADGMGGHDGGEIASAMIVQALSNVSSFSSAYAFRSAVCAALHDANSALIRRAGELGSGPVGSTVVALLAYQGHFACVWAGDSRCYLQHAGELKAITRDHSLVQGLVDAGVLRGEERRKHPSAHVITRAVGAEAGLQLDNAHGVIRSGDRFLLCSDGLTAVVDDKELNQLLVRPPLEGALEKMLALSLARGAPDNVTAILIGVEAA